MLYLGFLTQLGLTVVVSLFLQVLFLGMALLEPDCEASYRDVMAFRVYSFSSESFRTIYFHSSDFELVSYAILMCEDYDKDTLFF